MNTTIYGRVQTPQIDYSDLPMAYWPSQTVRVQPNGDRYATAPKDKISAVCRTMADCDKLVEWFGNQPDFCPDLPILLLIPGAHTVVTGLGMATAAELRDCCTEAWGVKTGGDAHKRFNGDEIRERLGLARREDVTEMTREAFHNRRQRHLSSPVTDPVKQFRYPNETNRTLHTVASDQTWKDE